MPFAFQKLIRLFAHSLKRFSFSPVIFTNNNFLFIKNIYIKSITNPNKCLFGIYPQPIWLFLYLYFYRDHFIPFYCFGRFFTGNLSAKYMNNKRRYYFYTGLLAFKIQFYPLLIHLISC